MTDVPRVADLPDLVPRWMLDAAVAGGAELVPLQAADTVVWGGGAVPPARLSQLLADHGERIGWVQLPWAGVEPYLDLLDDRRTWTCAKAAYGDDVAEMALALMLAGLRGLAPYARATTWRGPGELGTNLFGARVVDRWAPVASPSSSSRCWRPSVATSRSCAAARSRWRGRTRSSPSSGSTRCCPGPTWWCWHWR